MLRHLMTAAAAAAAVLLFGVVSGSAAVNNADSATTFTVVQTTTSMHLPPGGISPGSTITFTADVSEGTAGRHVAGRVRDRRRHVGAVSGDDDHRQGPDPGSRPDRLAKPSSTVAIVGGTGAYKSARGFITRKQLTATTTEETYHLVR